MGTVAVKWVASQLMTGVDSFGHPLVMGSWPEKEPEWAGLKPSDLLLLSAAACSAYDVVMILTKQREPLVDLNVTCTGEQESEPPYTFTSIHLHYRLKGPLDPNKVARAIRLSEDKYCSVVNTLKPAVKITSDFELVE
ncbi:MAG: OsmC family protein [candidate division Zixibacteria bacterium]|nr:OsmC family protein [candidate division Zixibacteria bacterium]